MRTTLTIDDDVAIELERLHKARDVSYKELVNQTLRLGLQQMTAPGKPRKRVRTRVVDLGEPRLKNVDNIAEVLAFGEGEDFK
jgi:adenine C2-methylase RlmN of 23S rRNA A2503 and tRNA A37